MPDPRFLQVHFLTPYTAALLNRDDSGLAKRLPYGGAMRTRISSQCLKRHWRIADDPHALDRIEGVERIEGKDAFRSRETIDRKVLDGLTADETVLEPIRQTYLTTIYGENAKDKRKRQTLLLGAPEIAYLRKAAQDMIAKAAGDPGKAKELAKAWGKTDRANLKAMAEATAMPAGLVGALFGRMVTSDPDANITAPVHVAHAFTVHEEEDESDYFTAVDDLARADETGADTIQETELTSGLFYGYVVVDLPGLIGNLGGDRALAGKVLHNLIYLIAEVSPGANLGSTAPYSRASLMLLEAGDRQPRSLAEAFRTPCKADTGAAIEALTSHLAALDDAYATGEERRFAALSNHDLPGAARCNLADLATWAKGLPARLAA